MKPRTALTGLLAIAALAATVAAGERCRRHLGPFCCAAQNARPSDSMLRPSIGLEEVGDLIADLNQALA